VHKFVQMGVAHVQWNSPLKDLVKEVLTCDD